MKTKIFCLITFLSIQAVFSQKIDSELVEFQLLKQPKNLIEENARKLKVTVTSPYNITTEDVINNSKLDFQKDLKNYDNLVIESQNEFQQKTKDHDLDVKKAKEQYELENTEFKKYSLLERLAMTDQKKNPVLVVPSKPVYYKPLPPVYVKPDLNNYIIVNNEVLASKININGFTKDGNFLDVLVDIQKMNFQDNAGQSFASQPAKITVKVNGVEKSNTVFFKEPEFISSTPTNNINKPYEEKIHLDKVVNFINKYLNDNYGFQSVTKKIFISTVKNKGKYDDLEKSHLYVTTNLKKLQPEISEMNEMAYLGIKKGTDIWQQTLDKIEYKNPKSDFNSKIAKYIYFNFMRLNLALDKKKEAEKYLNQLQENLIYMDLNYDEKTELKQLENEMYKK